MWFDLGGNAHHKSRAYPHLRAERNVAAQLLDERLHDGEAQARGTLAARRPRRELVKLAVQDLLVGGRDAGALVLDADAVESSNLRQRD